jgi:hypothetical protein
MPTDIQTRLDAWADDPLDLAELVASELDGRAIFQAVLINMDGTILCQTGASQTQGVLQISIDSLAKRMSSASGAQRKVFLIEYIDEIARAAEQLGKPKAGPGDDPSIDPLTILPMVKPAAFLDSYPGLREQLVWRHLVADLHIVFAVPSGNARRFVRLDELPALGFSLDDVAMQAGDNFMAMLEPLTFQPLGACFMAQLDNLHEPSLLMIADLMANLEDQLGKPLHLAVPANGVLLVSGSNAPDSLEQLKRGSQVAFTDSSHPISTTILEWTGSGYRPIED